MTSCRYNLGLIIGLAVLTIVSGDESVLLQAENHQRVTSDTLNWIQAAHLNEDPRSPREIVIGGFQKIIHPNDASRDSDSGVSHEERPVFVCRASHSGLWVAGRQIKGEKRCTVTLLGNVHTYERYELLENVENAARLSWINWDKFHTVPLGTVTFGEMFIARYVVKNEDIINGTSTYTHYIGTLDKRNNKLGTITYVKDDGSEGSADFGEVLVETKPVYYELKSVKFNYGRKKIHRNDPRIIGEAKFENTRNTRHEVAQAFGYQYHYFSYWGQGHAIIKALNTTITLMNGTTLEDICWGMDINETRESVYKVEIHLEPGTTVNVTLRANDTDIEVPYTGELVSYYADGESKSREISVVHRERTLTNITPEFSAIYFINNGSIVPTTLPPPTTQQTTTTITTKSTMTSATSAKTTSSTNTLTKDDEDENMIIPPRGKSSDTSNMQNDDGGPQSLKNKEEGYNSSNIFKLSFVILLTSLGVSLYRIT